MNHTPTVAWLIDSLRLGGAERLAVELAQHPPAGWRVELIVLQAAPDGNDGWRQALRPVEERLHCLRMVSLRDGLAFARLVARLRRLQPDLLHTHLDYATVWGGVAARLLGLPHVTTVHVLPPAPGGPARVRAAMVREAMRRATRRIFVSQAQLQAWANRLGAPQRACVVWNGVAGVAAWTGEERDAWRRRQGLPATAWVAVTVAVVRAAKGWREWLAAAEQVMACHREARFVWVGGGPEFGRLRQAVEASPARHGIRLTGPRTDVTDWLRGADVFVLPSHGEALPTAVIEAMAAGLAVVATDIPANREALGSEGTYVPVGDGPALARALLRWADPADAGARRRRGAAAQARWGAEFSLERWRARLEQVYAEVARPRPRDGRVRGRMPEAGHEARPAQVLMVEFFARGGLFHYSWQLSQALAGCEGTQVTLLTGRRPECVLAPDGVRLAPRLWTWNPHRQPRWVPRRLVRVARGGRYVAAWAQVLLAVHRERPDVVLLGDFEHRCDAWFVGWLSRMARRQRFRLADIWHNVDAFERGRPGRLIWRAAWRERLATRLDVVFVHGEALASALAERTGILPRVIAHGNQRWLEEQAGDDPGLGRRLLLPARRTVALLFGTLSEYKGVGVLIEALALVPAERRPVAIIAGMPSAAARPGLWRRRVRELNLEAWVRWDERYVPTRELAWYFRRADLVVLPYLAASQSGVAHAALTFAKPLIVSRTGALPELIEGNGVIVPPGDAPALAEALARLSQDPRLRKRMGRRSGELAATRHDWGAIARVILAEVHAAAGAPERDRRPILVPE